MRESCSTLVETSSKLEDPRLPIADSSPISRGRTQHKNTPTPVAHSTPTKINTGTTTDQRHSSNLFGTPIRGSSKIPVRTPRLPSCGFATPTKTPLLVSRVPNRGGPASEIKTTFHFHGTDRGQPTDYRSPLKFSLSTPTKGEPSEEAFSHSNAIFNQIVNSKSAQVNYPYYYCF